MPRFYFHLRADMTVEDEEGVELSDMNCARTHAEKAALHLCAASILEHRKIDLNHRIEVADEWNHLLFAVAFGDVVAVQSSGRTGK